MSFRNQHMASRVSGIRCSVSVRRLVEILTGTTWENFKEKHVSNQEYGSTRFNDLTVVAYYFKHHFMLLPASRDIGYSHTNCNGGSAIIFRLKRINPESLLDIGRGLISVKLISINDIKHILTNPVYPTPHMKKLKVGKAVLYKYFAKRMVMEAISKWGTEKKAAKKLTVKLKVVQYWAALDTKDPMVKHTQNQ